MDCSHTRCYAEVEFNQRYRMQIDRDIIVAFNFADSAERVLESVCEDCGQRMSFPAPRKEFRHELPPLLAGLLGLEREIKSMQIIDDFETSTLPDSNAGVKGGY